jgi:hypothetical protein
MTEGEWLVCGGPAQMLVHLHGEVSEGKPRLF